MKLKCIMQLLMYCQCLLKLRPHMLRVQSYSKVKEGLVKRYKCAKKLLKYTAFFEFVFRLMVEN